MTTRRAVEEAALVPTRKGGLMTADTPAMREWAEELVSRARSEGVDPERVERALRRPGHGRRQLMTITTVYTNNLTFPLRNGLDFDSATDILWTLKDPALWTALVTDRGWPAERYQQWLAGAMQDALLPTPTSRRRPQH